MSRSRQEVIATRDLVNEKRKQRLSWEAIAHDMDFECGVAEAVAYSLDLILSDDNDEITGILEQILAENVKAVNDYKSGKKSALGSLIGATRKKHSHLDAKKVQYSLIKMLA